MPSYRSRKYHIQPNYTTMPNSISIVIRVSMRHWDSTVRAGTASANWTTTICGTFSPKSQQTSGKKSNSQLFSDRYFAKKLVNYRNAMVPASIVIREYPFPIIQVGRPLFFMPKVSERSVARQGNSARKIAITIWTRCASALDSPRWRAERLTLKHSTNPTKPESYEGFRDIVRQERMIELALERQALWGPAALGHRRGISQ